MNINNQYVSNKFYSHGVVNEVFLTLDVQIKIDRFFGAFRYCYQINSAVRLLNCSGEIYI